ncbi:MAG: hypothetical protein RLY97_1287 [Pseudomonadota bacterium]
MNKDNKDIVILAGESLEQVRSLAVGKYTILYERMFDSIDTDSDADVWGAIVGNGKGAVAIAKWQDGY